LLPRWMKGGRSAILLAGSLLLLIFTWLGSVVLAPGRKPEAEQGVAAKFAPVIFTVSPTPFQPGASTSTPFQPVTATPTATMTASPTPLPMPGLEPLTYMRFGIDFSDTSQTTRILLSPSQADFNAGKPIRVSFRPGWPCEWINRRACTSLHYHGQVVLVTVHSGVAGDGQALRHALEGTWLNAASFPLKQVRANLAALQDGQVSIDQPGATAQGLRTLAAVRLPAAQVEAYFSLPVDDALDLAAQSSTEMALALASGAPLVVIETCGWRHPEEPWAPGVTDTSAAIYLITIGE